MAEINKMYNQCICWVLAGYGPGAAQVMPVYSWHGPRYTSARLCEFYFLWFLRINFNK